MQMNQMKLFVALALAWVVPAAFRIVADDKLNSYFGIETEMLNNVLSIGPSS